MLFQDKTKNFPLLDDFIDSDASDDENDIVSEKIFSSAYLIFSLILE